MSSILLPAHPRQAGEAKQDAEPRYAVVSLRSLTTTTITEQTRTDWLEACYRLTSRVKRITADSTLLDLGGSTAAEALSLLQSLLAHLAKRGIEARAGIGPTPVVAQLVSQKVAHSNTLWRPLVISASDAPVFLKQIPLKRLLTLAPPDAITVGTLARLQRCGVRTLGQLARLDELTLRRQFDAVGIQLAAIAQGKSLYPFTPTPAPRVLRFCLRSAAPFTTDDALRQLPRLATGVAEALHEQGYEAGSITVVLQWTSGERTRLDRALRWRVQASRLLAQELERLIVPALNWGSEEQIDAIRCTLSDLRRLRSSQVLLWPQGRSALRERRKQLRALAHTLAERRKRSVLLASWRITEHAIFGEDGYNLIQLGHETDASPSSGGPAAAVATPQRQDRWQDAPLRLHWW
jgi:nucleotidyltransferase/DNA polymerase involved in DNA repair